MAGHAAAKKIAQIGGEKWDPHGNQTALERDSLGDEIDGEPISNEKENWIRESSSDDGSPGLRQFQKITPTGVSPIFGTWFLRISQDHAALGIADARMFLGSVVEPAPR